MGKTKLDEIATACIRNALIEGTPLKKIAEHYKVSRMTIYRLAKKEGWLVQTFTGAKKWKIK